MKEKRCKTKKRMQTQSKPSNRTHERNKRKTINNNEENELLAYN